MCVQNQKSIAPFPSSTSFYKFRHDGSVVYCFIVNNISFKVLRSVYAQWLCEALHGSLAIHNICNFANECFALKCLSLRGSLCIASSFVLNPLPLVIHGRFVNISGLNSLNKSINIFVRFSIFVMK